jgi:hypothetical protein
VDGIVVDDEAIERHLLDMVNPDQRGGPRDPDDDFRISLAGAQEKDAFLWWNGKWMKPRGATPTTHIFKLPIGLVGGRKADFSTSVDNEWLCLRLFKEFGLPTANAEIATFGKQRVLVVERFDQRRHFNSTAKKVGYGDNAEPLLQEFIARTPDVVEKVRGELPDGFSAAVADKVLDGVLAAAHALEAMPPS